MAVLMGASFLIACFLSSLVQHIEKDLDKPAAPPHKVEAPVKDKK